MLNKSILIGRLVIDPELKTTQQGTEVCSFRIAVDRAYIPKGGEKQTDFLNIVAWRHNATFVTKYFRKGQLIGVEGSIQTRDYTDKDGIKRYVTEIVVDHCFFVESKSSNSNPDIENNYTNESSANSNSYSNGINADFTVIDDDDLPF